MPNKQLPAKMKSFVPGLMARGRLIFPGQGKAMACLGPMAGLFMNSAPKFNWIRGKWKHLNKPAGGCWRTLR